MVLKKVTNALNNPVVTSYGYREWDCGKRAVCGKNSCSCSLLVQPTSVGSLLVLDLAHVPNFSRHDFDTWCHGTTISEMLWSVILRGIFFTKNRFTAHVEWKLKWVCMWIIWIFTSKLLTSSKDSFLVKRILKPTAVNQSTEKTPHLKIHN